jgi:LEA14-like dessication related protein
LAVQPFFLNESLSMRRVHAVILSLLLLSLSACALFPHRDPLNINVVGIEPLQSQDMEVRFAVKIRVQNTNETPIDYNGVALDLEVNGQPLASGVSDQSGSIARFSETVLTVPVSVSAFSVIRQTLGLSQTQTLNNLPYVLRGKLAGGLFGTMRFVDTGKLSLPGSTTGTW